MTQPIWQNWHQPEPTTVPPRDPPAGWSAPPVDAVEARRLRAEVLTMLLLAAVPAFIIGLQGINDPTSISFDLSVLELLASIAAAAGPAAMAVHLLWRDDRLGIAGFSPRSPGFIAGYGAIGVVTVFGALLGVIVVTTMVLVAFGADLETLGATEDESGIDLSAAKLIAAYAISITAGVTEEIVFRAYAITRLEELGWKRAAYIVPGAIFTVVHLYQGVIALVVIGALTVVFTWLFRWRRSIWPVMVAHALYDAIILTIAAFSS